MTGSREGGQTEVGSVGQGMEGGENGGNIRRGIGRCIEDVAGD